MGNKTKTQKLNNSKTQKTQKQKPKTKAKIHSQFFLCSNSHPNSSSTRNELHTSRGRNPMLMGYATREPLYDHCHSVLDYWSIGGYLASTQASISLPNIYTPVPLVLGHFYFDYEQTFPGQLLYMRCCSTSYWLGYSEFFFFVSISL